MKSNISIWPLIALLTTPFCIAIPFMWYATPKVQRHANPTVALWFMVIGWGIILVYSAYRAHKELTPRRVDEPEVGDVVALMTDGKRWEATTITSKDMLLWLCSRDSRVVIIERRAEVEARDE